MNNPPNYHQAISYNDYIQPSAPPQPLSKSQKIQNLITKYEIDNLFSEKLDILSNFEIVLLIDDSGSMNTPLSNSNHNTRWDELKEVVNIVLEIATIYDTDGIDINFLNRNNHENIYDLERVKYILEDRPSGLTPLNNSLKMILDKYRDSVKPVLIVIATDGIPTNDFGKQDVDSFKNTLIQKNHSKFSVSFLACSDQEQDVNYLNYLDRKVPNVDTLDDYNSELIEVKNAQGKKFSYTFGDHIVRLLLGPLCPELDSLDEKQVNCKCNIL